MGLLNGITDKINEVLDGTINQLPTLGATKPQFNPIPKNTMEIRDVNPEDAPQLGSEVGTPLPKGDGIDEAADFSDTPTYGSPIKKPIETVYGGTEVGVPPADPAQPITGPNAPKSTTLSPIPSVNQRGAKSSGTPDEIGYITDVKRGAATAGNTEQNKSNALNQWNLILKENQQRINTVLEERSFVDFYFPNDIIGTRRVAFFENPQIQERRSPRYASQDVIARNEPVRLYVGSSAREVTLTFNYTLPHIAAFWAELGRPPIGEFNKQQLTAYANATREAMGKFFLGTDVKLSDGVAQFKNDADFGPRLVPGETSHNGFGYTTEGAPFIVQLLTNWITDTRGLEHPIIAAAHYTQYAIDTLRASVVGDLTKLGPQGPPIVRFRHGTLFNEAPFIVTNFTVNYPKDKGYEVKTLMPRVVTFTVQLQEFRQTEGSHHGDIEEQLPGSSDIIDLGLNTGDPVLGEGFNNDRRRFNSQNS